DDIPLGSAQSGSLTGDLASGTLPTFSFVTPDVCSDTHNCSVGTGDAWLALLLPRIFDSPTYRAGRTAVFLVWDEDSPMPNVVVSPTTPPGTVSDVPFDHYSLLRTTEEMLGIGNLLGHAATAPSMRASFRL
ncbi:MAG TPA: alkaline phosphatase family protein, partial [Acidimicrobiales bacterium]|nr:alkaline phosphatase family protein [Acidimicrobiales bacterium]